jgi:hypothetical protein
MTNVPRLATIVMLSGAISACSTQSTPTAPSAPVTPAVQFADLKAMVGTYTLAIELDESCVELPALARRRTYRATLEDRGWHFLVVGIAGGGFSEPTQIGDLFSGELSLQRPSEPELRWNSFDIGCDIAEPLGDVGALAVCGRGPVTRTPSGLTATVTGHASVLRTGATGPWCKGMHIFAFEREEP